MISYRFWGSSIQVWSSWAVVGQSILQSCIKDVSQGHSHSRLNYRNFFQAHWLLVDLKLSLLAGVFSFLPYISFHRTAKNITACFPHSKWREREVPNTGTTVFNSLISKQRTTISVKLLLFRSKLLGPTHVQGGLSQIGIMRGHPTGWLSQLYMNLNALKNHARPLNII